MRPFLDKRFSVLANGLMLLLKNRQVLDIHFLFHIPAYFCFLLYTIVSFSIIISKNLISNARYTVFFGIGYYLAITAFITLITATFGPLSSHSTEIVYWHVPDTLILLVPFAPETGIPCT